MTQSLEDYLEAIYMISLDRKAVRVKDISEKLAVKNPSVINAVHELKGFGYLEQEHYGYIELTGEGIKQAKVILKKHTMLKSFLIGVLGVSDKSAEADACRMEHFLTDETLKKIESFMKKAE
jgi:DtxR family transcriptional regulator, Mn-dependent transcriptional regulator